MENRTSKKDVKEEIVIYESAGKHIQLKVKLNNETVWLTQKQIAALFGTKRPAITKHLHNIFEANELKESAVCSILEHTASDGKAYKVKYYNLDAIISVGYRVNSNYATKFRIWATSVLKRHLIEGYTINEQRLKQTVDKLSALQKAVAVIGAVKERKALEHREALGIIDVITDYSYALGLLDDYDKKRLKVRGTSKTTKYRLDYKSALKVIAALKDKFGGTTLFGIEKDKSFRSSIAAIYQTFDGRDLYPSVEEKAANLLYFIIKNHSFVDGNKRIAAAIFLLYLEGNSLLYKCDGTKRLADNALVALTLLIAESEPIDRDIIVTLVVNLINKDN